MAGCGICLVFFREASIDLSQKIAVKELGMSSLTVAARLGITQPAVSRLAQRGEKLAIENNLFLGE